VSVADIILTVIGGFFLIRGLFRGITGEVFSLAVSIGGFYCSLTFYAPFAGYLTEKLGTPHLAATAVSMAAIFLAVFLCCSLLDKIIKKILSVTQLSWMDKICGGVSGLLKLYVITLFVLVAGMIVSPLTGDAWIMKSKILIAASRTWPVVYPLLDSLGVLPDLAELQKEAKEYIERQAAGSIFNPDNNFAVNLVSQDVISLDESVFDEPDGLIKSGDQQAEQSLIQIEYTKNKMINYFLEWGLKKQ
jgi:uncharacterized membrane protein required for colicin V production